MQEHRQLSCHRDDGPFLRVALSSGRQRLAETSEVAVLSKWPEDVLRRLNQKPAQQVVSLFRDAQLRVRVPALASRRYKPEVRPDGSALAESTRMLERQDVGQRHDRAHSSHLPQERRLRVLLLPQLCDAFVELQDLSRHGFDRRNDARQRFANLLGNLAHRLFREGPSRALLQPVARGLDLSLIHISEPTSRTPISYAVF